MRTQAEVHADAEGEVLVGVLAPDVEAERIGEHRLVAVGGEVREHEPVAGGDAAIPERILLLRLTHEVPYRADPTDHLVHGVARRVGSRCRSPSWSRLRISA